MTTPYTTTPTVVEFVVEPAPASPQAHRDAYWHGFNLHLAEVLDGQWLTPAQFAALSPDELRGYRAAEAAETELAVLEQERFEECDRRALMGGYW